MEAKTIDQLNADKLHAEVTHIIADTARVNRETEKLHKELKWYEVTLVVAATLAIVAIAKLAL